MDGEVTGPRGAPPLVVLLSGHDLSVKFLSVFITQKINAAASCSQRSLVGRAWGDCTNSKLVQVLRTFYCWMPSHKQDIYTPPPRLRDHCGEKRVRANRMGAVWKSEHDIAVELLNCVGCDSSNKPYAHSGLSWFCYGSGRGSWSPADSWEYIFSEWLIGKGEMFSSVGITTGKVPTLL